MDVLITRRAATCMNSAGFGFSPVLLAHGVSQQDSFLARRYGEPARFANGQLGWSWDGTVDGPLEPEASQDPIATTTEYQRALHGDQFLSQDIKDPSGEFGVSIRVGNGCLGVGVESLFGSKDNYLQFIGALNQAELLARDSYTRLLSDAQFLQRNELWSECMSEAGYIFETIFEPINRDWDGPRPSSHEQAVATRDLECRAESDLEPESIASIEGRIQDGLLEQYQIDLTGYAALATRILSSVN